MVMGIIYIALLYTIVCLIYTISNPDNNLAKEKFYSFVRLFV